MRSHKIIAFMTATLSIFVVAFALNIGNTNAAHKNIWHKGNPKVLVRKGSWSTNYIKHGGNKHSKFALEQPGYNRAFTSFTSGMGYNPMTINYNMKKKEIGSGVPYSAMAGMNPHYKYLGNNYYLLKAGAMPSKQHSAMYYEFNDSGMTGVTNLVKVHDKNHIYIWSFDSNKTKNNKLNSKKSYDGYFIYNNKQK
ncbi:hypothetical protein DY123_04205 [Apilactobacillus micheneri]|uniref:hypothetical protein n=1 Tax=Apilactobacillus micheneri TaxID=1899430 RepID=UPI00112CDE4E|nr:hypothetical protein [Apilactobacillus micheneri]TPR41741.1 hypothetical protein DY123_04205 [Apilactobacillus micheneri]